MIKIIFSLLMFFLIGCETTYQTQPLPPPSTAVAPTATPVIYTMNSWSNALWSEILQDKIREKFDELSKATDWSDLCPSFEKKDKDKKYLLWLNCLSGSVTMNHAGIMFQDLLKSI